MVRAILEGRKTQTRRIVKGDAGLMPMFVTPFAEGPLGGTKVPTGEFGLHFHNDRVINKHVRCPYGEPGDRLWVRESHKFENDKGDCIFYKADGARHYVQDNGEWLRPEDMWKWRPSIHMPRWASRITLEVESVRVERLQAISEEDAKAEGADPVVLLPDDDTGLLTTVMHDTKGDHRDGFAALWSSINGLGSWQANPWVWVVGFKVIRS